MISNDLISVYVCACVFLGDQELDLLIRARNDCSPNGLLFHDRILAYT